LGHLADKKMLFFLNGMTVKMLIGRLVFHTLIFILETDHKILESIDDVVPKVYTNFSLLILGKFLELNSLTSLPIFDGIPEAIIEYDFCTSIALFGRYH
jgi:hypothetical protein